MKPLNIVLKTDELGFATAAQHSVGRANIFGQYHNCIHLRGEELTEPEARFCAQVPNYVLTIPVTYRYSVAVQRIIAESSIRLVCYSTLYDFCTAIKAIAEED